MYWLERYFLCVSEVASYGKNEVFSLHQIFLANSQGEIKILLREQESELKDFNFQMSNEVVKEAEHNKIAIHLLLLLRFIILLGNSY